MYRELAGDEGLAERRTCPSPSAITVVAVGAAEAAVDVAGVALARVELGHEGQRHALLGGDLLGAVLVDDVVVAGAERLGVAERDLVLAEVALALGRLDVQPGAGHLVADPAQQRLDPRGAQHRVVDVVLVGRGEVAVAGASRPARRCRGRRGTPVRCRRRRPCPASASRAVCRARICRGEATTGLPSSQSRSASTMHRARVPGHRPQRRQVRLHHEVAVAARPRRHRVAVDGVHVDVDGEQVVAALGGVLEDDVEEVLGRAAACPAAGPACR